MKSRLFAVLLVLCFAVGWLPISVNAEEIEEYSLDTPIENGVTIYFVSVPEESYIFDILKVGEDECFFDRYEELPEPAREGYRFQHWSRYPTQDFPFDPNMPMWEFYSPEIYLYGVWEEDTTVSYDVTFIVDGETYAEATFEDGICDSWPDAPEKDDAIFKQWQTEDGAAFEGTPDCDITLYACWYDCIIAYDPNGNLESEEFQPEWYPADIGDQTPPYSEQLKMDTHNFLGWEPEILETVTESITYTARWEEKPVKTFFLTYDPNAGGDQSVSGLPLENPQIFSTYELNTEFYEFPAAPVLTRTGFSFVRWNTQADGSGESVDAGVCPSVDDAVILYAIWERQVCQVTFGDGEPINCLWGECLAADCIPQPELDENGCGIVNGALCRFVGWNTQADGKGEYFTEETVATESFSLYPCWVPQVKITFQIGNGTWAETEDDAYVLILDIGASLSEKLPTPVPDETHKETGIWDSEPAAANQEACYIFTCDSREAFTVIFTDGEDSTTLEILEGSPLGALPVPVRTGWAFLGWYDGEIQVTADTVIAADMVLEARWEEIFSLTFDPNGGVEPPDSLPGPGPHRIPAITPYRPGHQFLGWSLKPDSGMVQFWVDDFYTPLGEDTLYAVWKPEEYQIRYNDGVKTSVIFPDQVFTAAYGDPTPAFSGRPSRKSYAFTGWKPAVSETVTGTALYEAQWVRATNPKTGDESGIYFWMAALVISSGCLIILGRKSRRF